MFEVIGQLINNCVLPKLHFNVEILVKIISVFFKFRSFFSARKALQFRKNDLGLQYLNTVWNRMKAGPLFCNLVEEMLTSDMAVIFFRFSQCDDFKDLGSADTLQCINLIVIFCNPTSRLRKHYTKLVKPLTLPGSGFLR